MKSGGRLEIVSLTAIALLAFAANSLLCRMALGEHAIDPVSFSAVRLVSGALALVPLAKSSAPDTAVLRAGQWRSALALFAYAIAFSWAYLGLNTATGARILFATVQATMIASSVLGGERLGLVQGAGVVLAASGLGYLLLPGATAPALGSALSMMVAGSAWGFYSLWGRQRTAPPLLMTAGNFVRAALPALLLAGCLASSLQLSTRGVLLAATSGAISSGLGYAVWYRALRGLSAASAAVVQLAVPALAALLGAGFLGEHPSQRLWLASALILGGIAVTLGARRAPPPGAPSAPTR